MKAMVLNAPHALGLEDIERPSAGTGEALIRVTHTGVCGTDLKIYQGGIPVHHPLIMGHEMIGQVVEGGDEKGLKSGTRVIVDPVLFCGACFHCQIGQSHLCPRGTLLGRDRDGGFAEYVVAPPDHVYPLPETVTDRAAPLIQVLTTCLHAQRRVQIFPGEAVVVLGLGVAGQLHVQLARARGAHPVIGITRSAWKRELAGQLGADLTLPAGEAATAGVLEATAGRGADLVIESVGTAATLAEAVNLVRVGGRLLVFGISTAKEGALPFYQFYFKELTVINARAAKGEDYPACIDLVQRGIVQLEPLVSHTMSLAELAEALNLLDRGGVRPMKIILEHI
jgi:L-iditol 2-dehydrogenase